MTTIANIPKCCACGQLHIRGAPFVPQDRSDGHENPAVRLGGDQVGHRVGIRPAAFDGGILESQDNVISYRNMQHRLCNGSIQKQRLANSHLQSAEIVRATGSWMLCGTPRRGEGSISVLTRCGISPMRTQTSRTIFAFGELTTECWLRVHSNPAAARRKTGWELVSMNILTIGGTTPASISL